MVLSHTVLHVDDDPYQLKLVEAKLNSTPYRVISLANPKQAIETLDKTGARIAILDGAMPKTDGITLLRDIKEHDGGIQVVMLTGLISFSTIQDAIRLGAEACFFKPLLDFAPLLEALDACLAKMVRWQETINQVHSQRVKATLDDLRRQKAN